MPAIWRRLLTGACMSALVFAGPARAQTPCYTLRFLEGPRPDAAYVRPQINDAGQMVAVLGLSIAGPENNTPMLWDEKGAHDLTPLVGSATWLAIGETGVIIGRAGDRAFMLRDGQLTSLPGHAAAPVAINRDGLIVGSYEKSGEERRVVVWRGGELHDLGGPQGRNKWVVRDINDAGVIAGDLFDQPYLWKDGVAQKLSLPPGARYGRVFAINNAGRSVGHTAGEVEWQPAVWELDGSVRLLDAHAVRGFAYGINDRGQAVGAARLTYNQDRVVGVLWDGEGGHNVNELLCERAAGTVVMEAWDINAVGQIVGRAEHREGGKTSSRAVLLTPRGMATPTATVVPPTPTAVPPTPTALPTPTPVPAAEPPLPSDVVEPTTDEQTLEDPGNQMLEESGEPMVDLPGEVEGEG